MEKFINELKEGDNKLELCLLVTNVTKGVSNAGAPYLSITFQDRTGTIEGKKWDVSEEDIEAVKVGLVIKLLADVIEYRSTLQLKILGVASIDQKTVDFTRYALPCPTDVHELERKINNYIREIKNDDCRNIVNEIVLSHYDDFISFPAATKNHHEFASGLLYHTVSMVEIALMLCTYYPSLDKDLLVSGAILHDIGKTTELSGPIATKYTLEGKLLGHITIMVSEIKEVADKLNIHGEIPLLLEHLVLSHHGEKEFGSPVVPLTREAIVLHMIDDLDAKMMILDKALEGVKPGEFSLRIQSMDGRMFYKPLKNK